MRNLARFVLAAAVPFFAGSTGAWSQENTGTPTAPKSPTQPQTPTQTQSGKSATLATVGVIPINQTPWFADQAVRKQLQVSQDQFNQMSRNYQQAWDRYSLRWNNINKNLTAEEIQEQMRELNNGFNREFSQSLDNIFTSPAGRKRYNQLNWQYQGYAALDDPEVRRQLNLSVEQQRQFDQYATEWNRQFNAWRQEFARDRTTITSRFKESRQQMQQRINETLTPQQRQQWNNLVGRPFDFAMAVFFPDETSTTTLKPVIP